MITYKELLRVHYYKRKPRIARMSTCACGGNMDDCCGYRRYLKKLAAEPRIHIMFPIRVLQIHLGILTLLLTTGYLSRAKGIIVATCSAKCLQSHARGPSELGALSSIIR